MDIISKIEIVRKRIECLSEKEELLHKCMEEREKKETLDRTLIRGLELDLVNLSRSEAFLELRILEELQKIQKPVEKVCKWEETEDDCGSIHYNTTCGRRWEFEFGDKTDNGVEYCFCCGGKIEVGK